MQTINHDPDEPPPDRSRSPWPIIWPILFIGLAGYFLLFEPNWTGIAVGFLCGAVLATWAIEKTGNKVPRSWRL